MFSSSLKFVYGLDPHAILPLQAAACRHTLSQVMCAQLHTQSQTYPQDLATSGHTRQGQQRASQDLHTDPQSAAPPPAWLVVARMLPPAVCQQAG